MNKCTYGLQNITIHCHYKAWKSQDIFYNSDCIRLKEENHKHQLVAKKPHKIKVQYPCKIKVV